jgi:hypothetical protein
MSHRSTRRSSRPTFDSLESRALLSVFTVTNTKATGPGSLSAAILSSNKQGGANTINFNIPGTGVHPIHIGSEGLPAITAPVTINGYSQPGSAPNTSSDPSENNAIITISLQNNLHSNHEGPMLEVKGVGANNTLIQGLSFINFDSNIPGVEMLNTSSVTLNGCKFGAMISRVKFDDAVLVRGGSRDTIGGTVDGDPSLQNVIGSYTQGIVLENTTYDAIVENFIGGEGVLPDLQKVGVKLASTANHNAVVNNISYQNTTPFIDQGTGNNLSGNTVVPR